jgi:hypothetical protein
MRTEYVMAENLPLDYTQLRNGATYVLAGRWNCPHCAQVDCVLLEGFPLRRDFEQLQCAACKTRIFEPPPYEPFLARYFVPLNDPDARITDLAEMGRPGREKEFVYVTPRRGMR